MERLTRPTVKVDETAAKYMVAPGSIPADLRSMNDRMLDLVINGPTRTERKPTISLALCCRITEA